MQKYAERFYKSQGWQQCRDGYLRSVGGLCENCMKSGIYTPAVIVHHKIHINQQNINDPTVTYNWNNLQALCRDCHAATHTKKTKRFSVDARGNVTGL